MKATTEHFLKFRPMIEKFAWSKAVTFRMDVEDVRSQAYLIFCEAAERFDGTKASFSTYLYQTLRGRLTDYCYNDNKLRGGGPNSWLPLDWFEIAGDYDTFARTLDKLSAVSELTSDAKEIVDFIIGRSWEIPGITRRPSLNSVQNHFYCTQSWSLWRTQKAWEEIKTWWRKSAA